MHRKLSRSGPAAGRQRETGSYATGYHHHPFPVKATHGVDWWLSVIILTAVLDGVTAFQEQLGC